jgi:flagellar motor protein MotB
MPNSSILFTQEVGASGQFTNAVATAPNLAELLDLVPAPYRPRMSDLVNKVYRAAIKSNHTRSYLVTLQKHEQEGDFPPEIGARIAAPALQISKEYSATAEYKSTKAELDNHALAQKKVALEAAIELKKNELAHLQSLFAEKSYEDEAKNVVGVVLSELLSDAGLSVKNPDGSSAQSSWPEWIRIDYERVNKNRKGFPARAISLAFMQVSQETSRKMRGLSLKKETDDKMDVDDDGDSSRQDTVDAIIERKLEAFKKELKLQNVGTPLPARSGLRDTNADPLPRKEREREDSKLFLQKPTKASLQGQEARRWQHQERQAQQGRTQQGPTSRRKRKRQEVDREVKALGRALRGCSSERSGCGLGFGSALTALSPRSRVVGNTPIGAFFAGTYSELFCGVSSVARKQFVAAHTPAAMLDRVHEYNTGLFMGEGIAIPKHIEWQLCLNLKFILHHNPNPFIVHPAWQQLERSVRLRWHFRDSSRPQSKFYVPKPEWQPHPEQWNPAIEAGLRRGKDLLLERVAALNLCRSHKSNPDLRQLKVFLESQQILMKITDKNLGIAAISKTWYQDQCVRLLDDNLTYDPISHDEVLWYQREAFKRIQTICEDADFSDQVKEYLLSSDDLTAVPEFHAIPKVHKLPWKLRPIVPSHSWVTRKASEVCDFALRAFHKRWFPWVVDSTREVIRRVECLTAKRTEEVWIVTGDVESFYTNVSVASTVDEIRQGMHSMESTGGVDMTAIADLAQVVMSTNCFGFNGTYYHQTQGIAMGTSCAPSFANVNLGLMEVLCLEIVNADQMESGLILYVRYIDDILLVFKGNRTALQSCLDNLSTKLQPFTIGWEISSTREPRSYLDIEFFFDQGYGPLGLQSRVYRKRMNKHQYIPWSSAHPEAVKKAFIKAEMTRFMVISSAKSLFEERVTEFMQALRRRGYPSDILHVWRKQVRYEDRAWSLSERKDKSTRGLPLMLPSSYDEVWEHIDCKSILQEMRNQWVHCGEPLPPSLNGPLIKSLRRTDNLFDKLSAWNKAVLKDAWTDELPVPPGGWPGLL